MPLLLNEQVPARNLWLSTGLPEECLENLNLSKDPDSAINSSFKIGSAAQTTIGLAGLSAAHFHELRTGVKQTVKVDARHAVLEFRSEAYYTLDQQVPGSIWDSIAGLYKTKDSNFIRVHTNFPHHRHGILNLLNLPDSPQTTRAQVQEAFMQWNAEDFEDKAAESGMCAFALRTFAGWDQHPQALALKNTPPVTVTKIGEAPKRTLDNSSQHNIKYPLENVKVLDLSRVLAGPVAGRTLAAHGADVLLVTSPNLPALPNIDVDTSRGKRTTQLDLTCSEDRENLQRLVGDADVFLQAYRPGALDSKGFGVQKLLEMNGGRREHGIVCANLCAWGWEGPWGNRRGFDSLVQTATGFNAAEAQAYNEYQGTSPSLPQPKPFPVQALDHAAGYLLACGVNVALCKTITEGGSWEVRVSLAAVGQWLRSLGRISPEIAFGGGNPMPPIVFPPTDEVRSLSTEWAQSNHHVKGKRMTALKHAAILSETPAKDGEEADAPIFLNSSTATWID
ncbi:CoA-transferase family III [Gymnopus androsaceus JB14]|uniref:CoA-transferase family III n=1 Tax=Gymnopus androsaceus JB14 TaxID=1447944 RepID=A0A6A4HVV2_9AGAR|nr:CoA-transferase family III [Gymnopus androsaceus JB14]